MCPDCWIVNLMSKARQLWRHCHAVVKAARPVAFNCDKDKSRLRSRPRIKQKVEIAGNGTTWHSLLCVPFTTPFFTRLFAHFHLCMNNPCRRCPVLYDVRSVEWVPWFTTVLQPCISRFSESWLSMCCTPKTGRNPTQSRSVTWTSVEFDLMHKFRKPRSRWQADIPSKLNNDYCEGMLIFRRTLGISLVLVQFAASSNLVHQIGPPHSSEPCVASRSILHLAANVDVCSVSCLSSFRCFVLLQMCSTRKTTNCVCYLCPVSTRPRSTDPQLCTSPPPEHLLSM